MHRLTSLTPSHGITFRLALFYGASFAAIGISLPYWPVWLAAQGLSAAQIGLLLAASFWPRVVTSVLIPYAADRRDAHRQLMVGLAAITVVAVALFAAAGPFWTFLLLSMVVGASGAAILPVGEAMVLQEVKAQGISYGRVRLWGSLAFMLTAIGGGLWIERTGPGIVLGLMVGTALLNLIACLRLPEYRAGARPTAPPRLDRLLRQPALLAFVLAAGLIQVSHAVYYGFASLYWQAQGYSETVIGSLWAEGVLAEIFLFAAAGALLRRLEPVRLLALAGGVAVVRWALSALATDLPVLIFAQALHAMSFGATHLAAMHYLRDQVPAELQASAQGFYAAIGNALLFGLITPVAGWLYAGSGGHAFWPMAALALAGSGIAFTLQRAALPAPE
jgi:MFS transporter, PPP family, 3-phenylpropionic acid transporter